MCVIIKAAPGDVVLVAPGVYHEQLDFLGKGITVTSEMGPEQTIIDANRSGKGVVFLNGEPLQAVLHGFTVTQGMERLQGETTDSFSIIYWQVKEIHRIILEGNPEEAGVDLSLLEHISPVGWDNVLLQLC